MKKSKNFKLKKKFKNITSYQELAELLASPVACPFKKNVKCPANITLCEQCIANALNVEKSTDKVEVELPSKEYGSEYKNVLFIPRSDILNFDAHYFATDTDYSQYELFIDNITGRIFATTKTFKETLSQLGFTDQGVKKNEK